jgi:hypothetical protein
MTHRVTGQVPTNLQRRPVRVLRPADAATVYAYPRPEVARLARQGGLHRLASGYYAINPPDHIGRRWLPQLEAAALGIAVADYGVDSVALMGLSAARLHSAIPRAIGVAVVAVPKQRPTLRLSDREAEVVFSRRDVGRLEIEHATTELGEGWITTVEQTILDLAGRPDLGGMSAAADVAIHGLLPRADMSLLASIASAQRRRPTFRRLLKRRG